MEQASHYGNNQLNFFINYRTAMWLSNSSVGRKFVMALSGAFLVLFVTFHCLMNAVAIYWPSAYNVVCEFLGANWYALLGTLIIAAFIVIHIIYALMLTLQNRKARGTQRYSISRRPASVEWSSQNMLVLGIVVLAFLVVHLIQFWAKMQLDEVLGGESMFPHAAGTLYLQEAFSQPWTLIVYAIGFVALWFHLNHGFWSMFQSVGWDNTTWMPRLKKISAWWVSIVVVLFLAEGIVFTVQANKNYYLTNPELREQYKEMIAPIVAEDFGPEGAGLAEQIAMSPYNQVSMGLRQMEGQMASQLEQMNSEEGKKYIASNPQLKEQLDKLKTQHEAIERCVKLFDYLEANDNKPEDQLNMMAPSQTQNPQ